MSLAGHDFGEMTPVLKAAERGILGSAGPISDAFIVSTDPIAGINGPAGSGKTIACIKKTILEAQRMRPWWNGNRRYELGAWREKYVNLWGATLPSWWKVLPKELGEFKGVSGREAEHVIRFRDRWSVQGGGDVELVARFRAFGDVANPEDLKGLEYTDVWLNEMDTMPEDLFTFLVQRVGRAPPVNVMGRIGRVFGDFNAPPVTNWVYSAFIESPRDGYALFRQPGGRAPGAENLDAMGRGYYEHAARINAHRPGWVRRMVDNRPGYLQDASAIYPEFDDDRHVAPATLDVHPQIPVVIGVDAGLTPAAVFQQEMPDGQVRWLAEIAMDHAGEGSFARAVAAVMASPRFRDCEFVLTADPAADAGADTEESSWGRRVAKLLGLAPHFAPTNDPSRRWEAVRELLTRSLDQGRPGFLLDPSCKGLRRGFNETYHFRKTRGTDDLAGAAKSFDSHVHDAGQYAALETGSARARLRASTLIEERRKKREAVRDTRGRYDPFRRRA